MAKFSKLWNNHYNDAHLYVMGHADFPNAHKIWTVLDKISLKCFKHQVGFNVVGNEQNDKSKFGLHPRLLKPIRCKVNQPKGK